MTPKIRRGRQWRIPRTGVIAALVTFMMLGGTGLAYGYWSAQASATSTAKATSLTVSVANLASIQNTFQNNVRTKTGSFTVANSTDTTSSAASTVGISLGIVAGGSALLAGNIDVTVWGPTTAASCTATATPSGTVKTGTWATFTGYNISLPAGQSSTWCVRSTNSERSDLSSPSGTLSIAPKVTATMTVGTWTAQASASTTQTTSYIYPATTPILARWYFIKSKANGKCLDVKGAGGVGVEVIEWT